MGISTALQLEDEFEVADQPAGPCVMVVFGAAGDLTRRKLVPALYNLFLEESSPEQFQIIGVDRQEQSNDAYLKHLREGVDQFSRSGRTRDEDWIWRSDYGDVQLTHFDLNDGTLEGLRCRDVPGSSNLCSMSENAS